MANKSGYWVGADIGGTFTDIFALDAESGLHATGKILTDHLDPTASVAEGLRRLIEEDGIGAQEISRVLHATTLVTNAVLQRRGAKIGLMVSEGFRDAVEIGTEHRFDLYDLNIRKPEPLVPRELRRPVRERILADGSIEMPLDHAQVRNEISVLLDFGVKAIAVCLHHSYRNPKHERELGELISRIAPGMVVTLSSDVASEIREYQRASTISLNAYVIPLVEPYVKSLEQRLGDLEIDARLLIMQSNGGMVTAETSSAHPVRLLESGPAAGAIGAAHIARRLDRPRVLSFDMGGTTAKAYIVDDGEPLVSRMLEVAHVHRFKKGSGLPVQIPAIDMIEIGAGGGSIAAIDRLGLPKVGPQSAESNPGPACYGQGGELPTVTDADLVLGYIGVDSFLGGRMKLDEAAARRALHDHLAKPLGISIDEAAWGVHSIVNENMAAAARMHMLERGRTPSDYSMVAFGGAGPVHAYGVARALRQTEIIVPRQAGVGSAFGLLCAPVSFERARSHPSLLAEVDWSEASDIIDGMTNECRRMVEWAGVDPREITISRTADMRFRGQGHEIRVHLDGLAWPNPPVDDLSRRFREEYRRMNAFEGPDAPIEVITWRGGASGPVPRLPRLRSRGGGLQTPGRRERDLYFKDFGGFVQASIIPIETVAPGEAISGPAVVELGDSNLVFGPDASLSVHDDDLIVIQIDRQG